MRLEIKNVEVTCRYRDSTRLIYCLVYHDDGRSSVVID